MSLVALPPAILAAAPGKLVLSGAYSVLEGAPALVGAVDRYVTARANRAAELLTDEVAAAMRAGVIPLAPWFDASELRSEGRKLGIGSSAAILVASLGAVLAADGTGPASGSTSEREASLRARVLGPALAAHRAAQAGGSGVDVAAAVHGGVIRCLVGPAEPGDAGPLTTAAHALPAGVVIEVFSSSVAASTRDLLARVHDLRRRDPAGYRGRIEPAAEGARSAVSARTPDDFVRAVAAQVTALGDLGAAAGAPILTPEVATLRALAASAGASFGPSGAGGGDIALHVGITAATAAFVAAAERLGLRPLGLAIGARGLHLRPVDAAR